MKIYIDSTEILDVNATSEKLLENDLLDIPEWIKNAINGKIESCYGRFKDEWFPKLMNDPEVTIIPANRDDFVATVIARPDYKNRTERDAEAAQQQP